jgi:hypothetical protein
MMEHQGYYSGIEVKHIYKWLKIACKEQNYKHSFPFAQQIYISA